MKFYSKRGKKRLQKLWTDHDLDKELTVSTWIMVGPSDTLVLEAVSDYLQHLSHIRQNSLRQITEAGVRDSLRVGETMDKFSFQRVRGASDTAEEMRLRSRIASRQWQEIRRTSRIATDAMQLIQVPLPAEFRHLFYRMMKIYARLEELYKTYATRDGTRPTFLPASKPNDSVNQDGLHAQAPGILGADS